MTRLLRRIQIDGSRLSLAQPASLMSILLVLVVSHTASDGGDVAARN